MKNSCLDRDFVVVIKPDEDATYRNTVDMLDEMTINGVKRYAMIDITPQELEVVKKVEETNKIRCENCFAFCILVKTN